MNPSERELNALQNGLDRHGADLGRWPAVVRRRAAFWLARSAQARGMLAEARRLDALLREEDACACAPSFALRERMLSAARERPEPAPPQQLAGAAPGEVARRWLAVRAGALRPVLAAAAPLALGFALGVGTFPEDRLAESVSWLGLDYTDASDGGQRDD